MASPLPCKELWHSALVNYGLERPSENIEIHVFRVILQTSLDRTNFLSTKPPRQTNPEPKSSQRGVAAELESKATAHAARSNRAPLF